MPLLILYCFLVGFSFALYGPFFLSLFPLPIVLLGLLSIWALPELQSVPVLPLRASFLAFVAALILWPNYLAIALPGLPWFTVLRLLGFPISILFLICLAGARAFRSDLGDAFSTMPWAWRLLIGFVVVQVVTIPFSAAPSVSLQKVVDYQVNWTVMFFVATYFALKPSSAETWARLICLLSVPICAIAIQEYRLGQLPWVGHIPSFLQINDESVARTLAGARRDEGDYRIQSTFSTPLGLAEYIALIFPFTLHFAVRPGPILFRVAVALWCGLLFEIVLLTDSRLGLVGCIVGSLLYFLYRGAMQWRSRPKSLFGPAIVLGFPVAAILAFVSTLVVGRFRNKLWGGGQYDASNQGRQEMYSSGVPMILKDPIGHGAGMGASTLGITTPAGNLTIDTYYIRIGLEYGVLGFVFYYGLIAYCIYKGGRTALRAETLNGEFALLAPLSIALLNFLIVKSVFSNEDNHPLAFMMMGCIVALVWRASRERPRRPESGAVRGQV